MNNILRKFKLDDLIYKFGKESANMFSKGEFTKLYRVKRVFYQKKLASFEVLQTIWNMIDIIYLAICSTNDYRGKKVGELDMMFITKAYLDYDEEKSGEYLSKVDEDEMILSIIYGHGQEEFMYQSIGLMREDACRNLELLMNIPKEIKSNINIEEVVQQVLGMTCKEYINNLMALFLISCIDNNVTEIEIPDLISKNIYVSKDNIYKIREYYSLKYKDYRSSSLGKHFVKIKPIIKTDNNRYIVSNVYLMYEKLIDGLYWIVREFYKEKDSQDFVSEFGYFYEKYFENLLNTYLNEYKFEKLEESKKEKVCDWKLETNKYIILIEQKTALIMEKTKEIYTDAKIIKEYLFKKILKGFEQLEESELKLKKNNKKVIKILLHYENLYDQVILEDEIKKELRKKSDKKYENIFMMQTREIERMVYILSKDEELFNDIIERKLELEKESLANKRSFLTLMLDFGVDGGNDYLDKKINHIEKILQKFK